MAIIAIVVLLIMNLSAIGDLFKSLDCEKFNEHREINSGVGECQSWTPSSCILSTCYAYHTFQDSLNAICYLIVLIIVMLVLLLLENRRFFKEQTEL